MSIIPKWLSAYLERRKARALVPWESCEWSPKKAREKAFKRMLVEQYTAMAQIQINYYEQQMLMRMRESDLLRASARAAQDRALAEYRNHFQTYQRNSE